jgi:hypothetical protein
MYMKKPPGVMLYFEIRPCLEHLTMDEQGQLFNAILDYGETGTEPNFDYMLGIAWDFIKPRLDRDKERYEEVSRKRSEAAQARWEAHYANAEFAMQTMPTTTSTPNSTSSSPSLSTARTTPPLSG